MTLQAAGGGGMDYRALAAGCGILIVLMVLAFFGVAFLRRRLKDAAPTSKNEAFTLDQLRQLYEQGQISEEEFGRAKEQMAAQFGVGRTNSP